jgi:hypothetical protein
MRAFAIEDDFEPALARLATRLQFGKICIDHAA